jgi:acetyl esterase/lipase
VPYRSPHLFRCRRVAWAGALRVAPHEAGDGGCPEAVEYAANLTASGVPCALVIVPGMYHGADGITPKAESMQEFRRSMMEHVRAHLQESSYTSMRVALARAVQRPSEYPT